MNNDFVAMATKQCPVCLKIHSDNTEILIHKNFRPIKKDQTFTGYGLCKEHQKLFDDGFIAMVAIEDNGQTGTVKQENAVRTGNIAHLRRAVFDDMFDVTLPESQEMVFISNEVVEMLEKLQERCGE